MWVVFVLLGAGVMVLGFLSGAATMPLGGSVGAVGIIAAGIGTGTMLIAAGLIMWYLTRIERRLQDQVIIFLAAQKPDHLDEYRINRLKGAVDRTWRMGV